MRRGPAELFRFLSSMDGVSLPREENRVWHRRVVPLLAVPNLIHGTRRVGP
jgi:hypothetical protein